MNNAKLKCLQEQYDMQLDELLRLHKEYESIIALTQFSVKKLKNAIKEEQKKEKEPVNNNLKNEIFITEHAIIRYLERYYKMDVDKFKQEILNPIRIFVDKLGDGQYPIGNGLFAIVKKNKVITVMNKDDY